MSGNYDRINRVLLVVGIGGLFWPQISAFLLAHGVDVKSLIPSFPKLTTGGFVGGDPDGRPMDESTGATGAPRGAGTPGGVVSGIGGGIASAAGVAGAAGASLATIGIISGVGAVAGILAWGILKEGWFRGGIEGVVVNPARDHFLSQFAPFDYMRDAANPPGFYGLAWLLDQLGQPQSMFAALTQAHTKAQLESAVGMIQSMVRSHSADVARLYDFATKDPTAPQRSV